MASVRASIVKQARTAASRLVAGGSGAARDCPAVDQLLRCAKLSENAAQTLEWAADTLVAHRRDRTDELAYQIIQAARARLEAQAPAIVITDTAPLQPIAWA